MNDKLFQRLLIAVNITGSLSTAALVAYTYYLYTGCSIISYIANRG